MKREEEVVRVFAGTWIEELDRVRAHPPQELAKHTNSALLKATVEKIRTQHKQSAKALHGVKARPRKILELVGEYAAEEHTMRLKSACFTVWRERWALWYCDQPQKLLLAEIQKRKESRRRVVSTLCSEEQRLLLVHMVQAWAHAAHLTRLGRRKEQLLKRWAAARELTQGEELRAEVRAAAEVAHAAEEKAAIACAAAKWRTNTAAMLYGEPKGCAYCGLPTHAFQDKKTGAVTCDALAQHLAKHGPSCGAPHEGM